ncbi:hypothetical protein VDR28_04185, partial [Xanthomonas campestris pv. campestris]|nr:hypothetical protein [Xanthomonas campestris pv. campestris]
ASSDSSIHKARRRSCDLRLKVRANQLRLYILRQAKKCHPKYFRESDRQQLGKSFAKPIQQSVRDPTVSKIKKISKRFL